VRRLRTFTAGCVVALLVVTLAFAWWTTRTARTAMSEQVIASERAVAAERAAQVADAVGIAHERLLAAAGLVGARIALENGDIPFLQAAVLNQTKSRGLTRITVTTPEGTVLAKSPQDKPTILVADDETHISSTDRSDAHVTFRAPFRNDDGAIIGWLHEEQSLEALVPRLTRPLDESGATASLVTQEGNVVASRSAGLGDRITTPELVALLERRTLEGVRYHSEELGGSRIAATAPVRGYPWSVVVDVDESAANGPADALVRRLLGGFALAGMVAGSLLAAISVTVVRTRRGLQSAHLQSQRDATTDALTGVLNRRAFDERMTALRGTGVAVGIAIVDIDDLKDLNDSHGHLAGDGMIKSVADAIRRSVRSQDSVFRIGGDEFAVLVDGVRAGEIQQVADRVVAAVGGRASVGAADDLDGDVDEAFRRADTAMYTAKRAEARTS
jgi:diguanylate cyclase (GGDEF)-like protein